MENRHAQELAIAQLVSVYANSQKASPPYYKPSDFYIFAPESDVKIAASTCITFLTLSNEQLLPSWALSLAPVDEIQKGGSKGGKICNPRMWMVRGLALITPKLRDGILMAGMAIIDDGAPSGETQVWDVDSGEVHTIWVPETNEPYLIDIQWLLENRPLLDMPTQL